MTQLHGGELPQVLTLNRGHVGRVTEETSRRYIMVPVQSPLSRPGPADTHTQLVRGQRSALTSNVISRTFLGILMIPESPRSPETQTQGLEVIMALLSFLMGTMTTL